MYPYFSVFVSLHFKSPTTTEHFRRFSERRRKHLIPLIVNLLQRKFKLFCQLCQPIYKLIGKSADRNGSIFVRTNYKSFIQPWQTWQNCRSGPVLWMPSPIVIFQTVKKLDQLLPEDLRGAAELRKVNAENVVVLVQIRTDPFFTFSYVRALIEARSQISRMVNNLPSTFTRRCSISMYRPRAALGS